jgi:hypothetical protein
MVGAFWDSFWFVPIYAALMTAAVAVGRFLARREERKSGEPRQCRVGPFERSVGAMLAFLLGFTFAMTGGDFRDAQAGMQREADAITEAYRWSQLMPEADRHWFEDSLRSYAARLIGPGTDSTRGPEAVLSDQEILSGQEKLWEGLAARRAAAMDRTAYDASLRAVNQLCQTYSLRYYLNRRRLADVVVLFIVGATLLLGFLVGYTSELRARHFVVMAALFVLFVSATVYLIWEVDRPRDGFITTSRQVLYDLPDRPGGGPR